MDFLSSVGLFVAIVLALVGLATCIYVLVLGSQQLRKVVRLGGLCQMQADEVLSDISVPAVRPRAVK